MSKIEPEVRVIHQGRARRVRWHQALEIVRWHAVLKPVDRAVAKVAAGVYVAGGGRSR